MPAKSEPTVEKIKVFEVYEDEWWMAYSADDAFKMARVAEWRTREDDPLEFVTRLSPSDMKHLTYRRDDGSIWTFAEQFEYLNNRGVVAPGLFAMGDF